MAQNPSAKHVDAVLTSISIRREQTEAVWQKVLPPVLVNKKSDVYYTYDTKERLRLSPNGGLRPPQAYTEEVDYRLSTANYACQTYAFGGFVEDTEQANADSPLDPIRDLTEDLTDEWHRHAEKRVADLVFTAANHATGQKTTLSGSTQWSHADSDPIVAILTGRRQIHGKQPNTLVINQDTELALLTHAKVLSRLTGGAYPGNPANVSLADLAILIRVDEIIVGTMEYDSTDKKAAVTRTPVWGKHALLFYREPKPGLKKISFGYNLMWKSLGGKQGFQVRKVRDDQRGDGGYKLIVEGCCDEVIVSTDMAYFWENAVA